MVVSNGIKVYSSFLLVRAVNLYKLLFFLILVSNGKKVYSCFFPSDTNIFSMGNCELTRQKSMTTTPRFLQSFCRHLNPFKPYVVSCVRVKVQWPIQLSYVHVKAQCNISSYIRNIRKDIFASASNNRRLL